MKWIDLTFSAALIAVWAIAASPSCETQDFPAEKPPEVRTKVVHDRPGVVIEYDGISTIDVRVVGDLKRDICFIIVRHGGVAVSAIDCAKLKGEPWNIKTK